MSIFRFNEMYAGTPPWDIGAPQPDLVKALRDEPKGLAILDMGCGTGENALFAASLGHQVWGVDSSFLAIEKAIEKARLRGIDVSFQAGDALDLRGLGKQFDVVIDSGLFHIFDDTSRAQYERSLATLVKLGGRYYLLCFSELEPEGEGPRRVTQDEIRHTFKNGWRVNWIHEAKLKTNLPYFGGGAKAWLSSITRKAIIK